MQRPSGTVICVWSQHTGCSQIIANQSSSNATYLVWRRQRASGKQTWTGWAQTWPTGRLKMHRQTVILLSPTDPTTRRVLEAFENLGRTVTEQGETGQREGFLCTQKKKGNRARVEKIQTRCWAGIGTPMQNMRASTREERDKSKSGWESYQNTVCLRVSQLEDVATSATRQNLLKRMTGNLFQTIVGSKSTSKNGVLSETERATRRTCCWSHKNGGNKRPRITIQE